MEDGKKAHAELHKYCGTPAGCSCDMCKDGKCKDTDIYDDYHNLQKQVCCKVNEGEDFKYECAKGTCGKCGWYEVGVCLLGFPPSCCHVCSVARAA